MDDVREQRDVRVLAAVQQRISDMPIRVSNETMRVLLRLIGLGRWEVGCERFREIDALALDALSFLASQRLAFRASLVGERG